MTDEASHAAYEGEIRHDRFHLCDVGDADDAFLVCGRCVDENERDAELYQELSPMPDKASEQGYTRECWSCGRNEQEVERGESAYE